MENKICTKCNRKYLATAEFFSPNLYHKDGLQSWCRKCRKEYGEDYNKEYAQEYRQTFVGCLQHRFCQIKQRCNNPKAKDYKNYGKRGIKCLFKTANEFIDYVKNDLDYDTYEKIKELAIDRIDNDGHYKKGNIRFITTKENNNNKRKHYASEERPIIW